MTSEFRIKKEHPIFFMPKVKIYWKEELLAEIRYNIEFEEDGIEIFSRKSGENWKFPLNEFRDCLDKANELLHE